jgi:hypothetical protein
MADDWRVTVTFSDAAHARKAVQAIGEHRVVDEVCYRLGDSVAVSADGPHLFIYAATEDAARAADRVLREVLNQHQLAATGFTLDRWHPDEQDWEDAGVPMPVSDEQRVAERQRLMDYQAQRSAAAGQAGWQVRIELPSHRQAVELAGRLRAEGRPVIRRWKYLILGAASEDEASALAGDIAQHASVEASIRTQVNPSGPFGISRPGPSEAHYHLIFFLLG